LAEPVRRHEGGDDFPTIVFGPIVDGRVDPILLDDHKEEYPSGDLGPHCQLSLTAAPNLEKVHGAVEIGIGPIEPKRQLVFACVLGERSYGRDEELPYYEVDGVRVPCLMALALLALRRAGDYQTADVLSAHHIRRR
jgi:hypothetical protein